MNTVLAKRTDDFAVRKENNIMEIKRADDCAVRKEDNVCIIEYDERSMGRALVSKVYNQGGVDISIRFVKQKMLSGGQIYDPGNAPEGIQRLVVNLVP